MKNYIFFDFDGTIMDSYSAYVPVWIKSIQYFNPSIKTEDIQKSWKELNGLSLDIFTKKLLQEFGVLDKEKEIEIFRQEIFAKYTPLDYPLYQGIEELLANLKNKGKYLAILSNGPKDWNDAILKSHNILQYFDKTISCLDSGFPKPNPKLLLKLIEEIKIDKSEVVYLGDTKTDLEFAVNAGIDYLIIDHDLHQGKFFETILNLL